MDLEHEACGERVNLSPTALYTGRSLEVGHGGSLRRLKLSSPGSGPFVLSSLRLTSGLSRTCRIDRSTCCGYGLVKSLWQLYGFSIGLNRVLRGGLSRSVLPVGFGQLGRSFSSKITTYTQEFCEKKTRHT